MAQIQAKANPPNDFALLLGTATMALVLDIESTKYAQHDPAAAEVNCWIYGERPSRSRMYAVSVPVTLALAALAGYLKLSPAAQAQERVGVAAALVGIEPRTRRRRSRKLLEFSQITPKSLSVKTLPSMPGVNAAQRFAAGPSQAISFPWRPAPQFQAWTAGLHHRCSRVATSKSYCSAAG